MKLIRLLFLLCLTLCTGVSAQNSRQYVIEGSMARDSLRYEKQRINKIYLTRNQDGAEIKVDSAEVKDKKFRFAGTAPDIIEAHFITGFDNGSIQILLEPGTTTITPFDAAFPAGAKISGTPNNDILHKYKLMHDKAIANSIARMNKVRNNLPSDIRNDEKAAFPYQNAAYFSNTLYYETEVMRFIKKHINSTAALFIIKYDLFNVLSDDVIKNQLLPAVPMALRSHPLYTGMVNKNIASCLAENTQAPAFTGFTPDKKEVKLSDLKGKYVFIDFWASWCGPCRREFPYIKQALTASEGHNKFVVLSYSIDDKEKAWTDCIASNKLTHPNWLHISTLKGWESDAVTLYNVTAVPRTVLISPSGKIIAFNLRGEEMLIKIRNILSGEETYE